MDPITYLDLHLTLIKHKVIQNQFKVVCYLNHLKQNKNFQAINFK
jgi:hypothetical protein